MAVCLAGCARPESPEQRKERLRDEAEQRRVALVNGETITEADLEASLAAQPRFIQESIVGKTGYLRYFGDLVTFTLLAQQARGEGLADDPDVANATRIALVQALWRQTADDVDLTTITEAQIDAHIEAMGPEHFVHPRRIELVVLPHRERQRLERIRLAYDISRGALWPPDLDREAWAERIQRLWAQWRVPDVGLVSIDDADTLLDREILEAALKTEELWELQGPIDYGSSFALFMITDEEPTHPMSRQEMRSRARLELIEIEQGAARLALRRNLVKAADIVIEDPALAGALDKLPRE